MKIMFRYKISRVIALFIVTSICSSLFYSSTSYGLTSVLDKLYQGNRVPLQNNLFNRDVYDRVGAEIDLLDVYNGSNYDIPSNSTWTWKFYQDKDALGRTAAGLFFRNDITYYGNVGGCPTQWSIGCARYTTLLTSFIQACLPEGNYHIEVLFNGNLIEREDFFPSRYTPVVNLTVLNKKPITPQLVAKGHYKEVNPGSLVNRVDVTGVAGAYNQCTTPLISDAIVKLSSTIKPNTGGHAHFLDENEIGTGKFVANSGDVLDPETSTTNNTVIEGQMNHDDGTYQVKYTAGNFGVTETITAEARREATDIYLKRVSELKSETIDIKVPDLMEMTTGSSGQFVFKFDGDCPHSPTARWVTSKMLKAITSLNNDYSKQFGNFMRFNDASLKFGGFFDNGDKGGGRESKCHTSHHRGIDIDVQRLDTNAESLETKDDNKNGIVVSRKNRLIELMSLYQLYSVRTGGYFHLRTK